MNYSVTNDNRLLLESILYLLSCALCVLLEVFVLSKITFKDATLNVIWILLQCAFAISPFFIVYILKIILKKLFFRIIKLPNLTGKYNIKINSNYNKGTTSHATIEIEQTLNDIKICFIADNSSSCAINAQIDNSGNHPKLYYMYHNDGKASDKKNKSHIGSAILTFKDGKISGFYYNNGNDRQTQGTIESV